jgi:CRISPR-associated protein Csb2
LANIMHEHADARIMGFAIAMPICATPEQWALLSTLFFGRDGAAPLDRILIGREAVPVAQVDRPRVQGLSPQRYVTGADVWTTVTPILLSRHPDSGRRPTAPDRLIERVRAQVAQDCVASGLPAPVRIEVEPASLLDGVGHARSFRQHRSGEARWATHATLFFDRIVHGPLLVGAGRYNGLGLLVPVPGTQAREVA